MRMDMLREKKVEKSRREKKHRWGIYKKYTSNNAMHAFRGIISEKDEITSIRWAYF